MKARVGKRVGELEPGVFVCPALGEPVGAKVNEGSVNLKSVELEHGKEP